MMFITSLRELKAREKTRLRNEIMQARGLMPLLMKPGNKQRWSAEDKHSWHCTCIACPGSAPISSSS
jgi:hypothetical protein